MAKGLNLQQIKNENRSSLLYLLNSRGEMSRKELASRLGLTPAAVTKICNSLIDDGFIREGAENALQGKSGRREIMLSLCLSDKYIIGINAEKDSITFSVSSLDGLLIASEHTAFSYDLNFVIEKAKEFKAKHSEAYSFIGAGVCVIGSPGENDFGIWKDNEIKEKFEKALRLPVVIENNVKAFVEGELIFGKVKNPFSVLFLKWGPGIGSAIVADGKVFSGSDSSVAEIGHYIVNPGGVKCRCGRFGCLETEAGENAIRKELNSQKPLDELLENCDNDSMNIIDHKIDMVALAVTNTATILSTDNIVFFGTMFNNQIIAEKLKKQCLRYNTNLTPDFIKKSSLNEKSAYIGCCAICAKHFFFEANGR
ncbi:MAG: ROK family transcriptional regulator [Eubacterium sp.]|nr:ROK family transcriptional regulator [Eubacterium sp.]